MGSEGRRAQRGWDGADGDGRNGGSATVPVARALAQCWPQTTRQLIHCHNVKKASSLQAYNLLPEERSDKWRDAFGLYLDAVMKDA